MCINPIYLKKANQFVPCSKCGNCIKRLIGDYTLRCQFQLKHSKYAIFTTLTYAKDPIQLYKKDLQSFFKRLRRLGFKFSYFGLGDYGDTYGRPHYHVLFFVSGFFNTDALTFIWQSGDPTRSRGFTSSSICTIGRISYVISYGYLAKLDWDKEDGRQRPFFAISKKPAIGSGYLSPEIKKYHVATKNFYIQDGRYKKPLPRYYKSKLFTRLMLDRQKLLYLDQADAKLQQDLIYYGKHSQAPLAAYYDAQHAASNNYLNNLRDRKNKKNKLL